MLAKSRERPEMILIAMHALGEGFQRYEDIVVRAFEVFPAEFALRGYPQFPDSSDIHKPLYGSLKKQGLVRSANKSFGLTPLGVERVQRLANPSKTSGSEDNAADRLTRTEESELQRVTKSPAFSLFSSGKQDRILDTDFYAVFACTVRTSKNDFIGRLHVVSDAVERAKKLRKPDKATADAASKMLKFLKDRFKSEITGKVG